MAKKGFSLDFNGFLDLAEDISNIDNKLLLDVVTNVLDETRKKVNIEIGSALKDSEYNFEAGVGYSKGKARKSLIEVHNMPVEVNGTVVTAYAGFDLNEVPEVLILAIEGAPNREKDKRLYNAIKVKGKVKKHVDELQEKMFKKALEEALKNG